jgi:hypothetical protein
MTYIWIGVLTGCAIALPCYWYGWSLRGRWENRDAPRCYLLHQWSAYEAPKQVTGSAGQCELGQRRECSRCHAVDYRRVIIHN